MKQILDASNPWELNALFIQPTRWCGLNCTGCYVKEHFQSAEPLGSLTAITLLFQKFYLNNFAYSNKRAWANQITVSMDDIPKDISKSNNMLGFFNEITTLTQANNTSDQLAPLPEVHLTFHTPFTIHQYTEPLGIHALDFDRLIQSVNMVSFSEIPKATFNFVKYLAKLTTINYNQLIPYNVTSSNIDKYVKKISEIGEIVDHIYLVIFKRPVGSPTNDLIKLGDRSRMLHDIRVIDTLMERLPESVRRKVSIDGCLQDTRKFTRTGFGCSSNVSRVQVWPDGSVTGCAYAFGANRRPGGTVKDILENIRLCRQEYDFRSLCHLPETYDSIEG